MIDLQGTLECRTCEGTGLILITDFVGLQQDCFMKCDECYRKGRAKVSLIGVYIE